MLALGPVVALAQTTLYEQTGAGGVSGYLAADTARGSGMTTTTATTVLSGAWVPMGVKWISRPLAAVTLQTTDTLTCNGWGSVSNTNANASLGCRIYRYTSGAEEASPFCSASSTSALTTGVTVRSATCNPVATTSFLDGDRIVIYWGAVPVGTMGAGRTVTLDYAGASVGSDGDTYLTSSRTIPFATRLTINNNGGTGDPAGATFGAGTARALDYFSLSTESGTSTVSQVNVTLTGSAALSSIELRSGNGCAGALLGTVSNPTATPQLTGLSLSATTTSGTTAYTLCGTGGLVSANTTVSANVSGVSYTGTFNVVDADTANNFTVSSTTLTIGNGSDPAGTGLSTGMTTVLDTFTLSTSAGSGTVTAVATALTGNAALTSVALWTGAGCTGTNLATVNGPGATPSFGGLTLTASTTSDATTYYVCGTAGSVGSDTTASINATGVTLQSGSVIVTDNDTGPNFTVLAPATLTIGNGSDPAGTSISAGTTAVLDTFTLSTSAGSVTVTAVATALTGNAALTSVALWTGAGCTGSNLATVNGPGATPSFGGLSLTASTTSGATTYYVCGTAGTVGSDTTASIDATGVTLQSGSVIVTDNDTGPNFTVLAPAILTIGNGSDPAGSGVTIPTQTVIDTFTLSTSVSSTTVSAVAMSLTGSASVYSISLWTGAACTGTRLALVANPSGTPSFTGLSLPASPSSGTTTYYVCVVPDAAGTVSANATGVTTISGTWTVTDNDSANAFTISAASGTLTINNGTSEPTSQNLAQGATLALDAFAVFSGSNGTTATSVTVNLTNGAALSAIRVDGASGCNGANYGSLTNPVSGINVIPMSPTLPVPRNSPGTTYYLCATGGSVASGTAVSGTVDAVAVAGYAWTDNDTTSATLTVQPAPSVTTSVADGTNPTPGTVAPLTTPVAIDVDGFDVSFTGGSDAITAVQVTLSTTVGIGRVAITNSSNAELGYITTIGSTTPSIPLTTNVTTAGSYKIRITPLSATAMPAPQGGTYTITARITDITVTNAKSVADANSGTLTIDNWSPGVVSVLSGNPGSGSVTVSWTTEPADPDFTSGGEVVVLVRQDLAPVVAPVEGTDYTGSGTEEIVPGTRVGCVAAPGVRSCTVSFLTSPNNYYFAIHARDAFNNYSVASAPFGPVQPSSFIADGDGAKGSTKPVVSIIDPMNGATLTLPAKVQVRVFSPGGRTLSGVDLLLDGAAAPANVTAKPQNLSYAGSIANVVGVWEFELSGLAAGSTHTLRATAANDATTIYSGTIGIKISANKGDGNLLVRDNSSQLCSDCHASAMSHSSEFTGTKFGSWATTCRDCHTPHKTTNISLVKTSIKPPERAGTTTAQPVVFLNRSGYAASSFASTAKNGVCQVCHTQTGFYRQDGTLTTHETTVPTNCAGCHDHKKGFKGSCTNCHGTDGFVAGVANADSNISAAPPALVGPTTPIPNAAPTGQVTAGNGHLLHLNYANFRTNPIQCVDCHATYSHRDGKADVAWGTLATSQGFTPTPATGAVANPPSAWPGTPTCTNWCHGQGLAGGGGPASVNWTSTAALGCSSCHGAPPPVDTTDAGDHPNSIYCADCHGAGYNPPVTGAARDTHIDGTINKPAPGCTGCHGVLSGVAGAPVTAAEVAAGNYTPAPGYVGAKIGVSTEGVNTVSYVRVGAHDAHVRPSGGLGSVAPISCVQCHGTLPTDTIHANKTIAYGFAVSPANIGTPIAPTAFDAAFETAKTCTNYCHSNGAPLGGSDNRTAAAPTWTSATTLDCGSCHANPTSPTFGATGLSLRHQKHVQGYSYACDECHRSTMAQDSSTSIETPANHVNGTHVPAFTTLRVTTIDQSGGTYSGSPNYTCASTYCHSDGSSTTTFGAPAAAAPVLSWNGGTTSAKCDNCHGGNATATNKLASGSHTGHVNNATFLGANIACAKCHDATAGADDYTLDTVTGVTSHVDGQKEVSATTWNDLAKTCASNSCHQSGQAVSGAPLNIPRYYTVTWGNTSTVGCAYCHGAYPSTGDTEYAFTSQFGEPNYKNGGASAINANSHQPHVKSAASCAICHQQTTANGTGINPSYAIHLDGARQVTWDATRIATGANYFQADKSCSNTGTDCHATATPKWGATLGCRDCHMTTGGDVNNYGLADGTRSWVNQSEWLAYGHGATVANYAESNNPGANFDVSGTDGCLFCHATASGGGADHGVATNPFRLKNIGAGSTALDKNGVCLICHGPSATGVTVGSTTKIRTTSPVISSTHYGTQHQDVTHGKGGEFCWDCHDPHGDYNTTGSQRIANMIHAQPVRTHATALDANNWGLPDTGTELAPWVDFRYTLTGAVANQFDWGDYVISTQGADAKYHGVCQTCHTGTVHFTNSAWVPAPQGDADHNPSEGCTVNCHKHEQPATNAFQGSGVCSSCHLASASAGTSSDFDNYVSGGGKPMIDREEWGATGHGLPSTSNYDSTNAGAGFTVTANVIEGCYYCHAPDKALYTGGPTSAHSYTTNPFRLANIGTGSTTLEKNGVCLVCHGVGTTLGFDPDGANTVFTTGKNASKKVDSTHYGADHLLVGAGQGGQYCWDCHDPHGDFTAGEQAVDYMVQRQPVKTHVAIATSDWGLPDKSTELGTAVVFNKAGGLDAANFDGGDYVNTTSLNGVCQSCHTRTTYWLANGTDSRSHEYAVGNTPARCVACHEHQQTTNGQDAFLNVPATSCTVCHPNPPTLGRHGSHLATNVSSTYGDTTFRSSAAAYSFGCGKCHGNTATNHMDDAGGTAGDAYRADVAFDLNNGTAATYPAIVQPPATTETGSTGLVFGVQNGTCSNTYCHDPLGAAYTGKTAVSWNTTATLGCTGCHDDAYNLTATLLPGAHGKHSLATGSNGYGYGCERCHANTVTDAATVKDRTLHVNNDKNDVRFNTAPLDQSAGTFSGGTAGTCSNTYCHSNGQDLVAPFTSGPSAAWNASAGCTSCHGGGGGASTTLTASHNKHVDATANDGYGHTCDQCHANTGNNTSISNKANHVDADATHDVAFNSVPITQTAGTYDATGKTCSNTYCHSNGQDTASPYTSGPSAAWGTTAGCASCHGTGGAATTTLGGAHAQHVIATASGGYNYACDRCHNATGNLTTITNKANHVDADVTTHDVVFNTLPLDQSAGTYNVTTMVCSNTYCHSNGQDRTAPFTSTSIAWNGTATCASCHAMPPTSTAHASVTQTTNCSSCHPGYSCVSQTQPTGCTVDYALHVNGKVDGGGGPNCTTASCHGAPTTSRRNAVADFSLNSHHVQTGGTTTGQLKDNDCWVCHAEYDRAAGTTHSTLHMNGLIDLRDADNADAWFQYDADTIRALGTSAANSGNTSFRSEMSGRADDLVGAGTACGTGCTKGLDRFCISCHDADGAWMLNTVTNVAETGATNLNPFYDTTITNTYDQQDRTRVVDIASRVHDTARSATTHAPIAAANRDGTFTLLGGNSAPVRDATTGGNGRNDPPEGIFSRHAIRGLTLPVYSGTNATWDTTSWWNRASPKPAWASNSLMGCADCHTSDGVNTTTGNAHGSTSEYLLKSATGTAAEGTTATTVVCAACHLGSAYTQHLGTQSACNQWLVTSVGTARVTGGKGGNPYAYACGNCHGGGADSKANAAKPTGSNILGGFGTIHGTSQILGITNNTGNVIGGEANDRYRATYRFTNGNSMRYYNPGTWTGGTRQCQTLRTADTWGGCTQHSTGVNASPGIPARPLSY